MQMKIERLMWPRGLRPLGYAVTCTWTISMCTSLHVNSKYVTLKARIRWKAKNKAWYTQTRKCNKTEPKWKAKNETLQYQISLSYWSITLWLYNCISQTTVNWPPTVEMNYFTCTHAVILSSAATVLSILHTNMRYTHKNIMIYRHEKDYK